MRVVKLCITSLDLHEFPDFEIEFDKGNGDSDSEDLAWFNPQTHLDILLLIMHQFMGFMNKKINIFRYPELFRLCQTKIDKQSEFKIIDSDGNYDYIDNLSEDVSNGLIFLSILESIKPGCVDWKNSGVRSEVRHKFDAINNCNYLIDILKTERTFKDIFHLVGIGGNNIVDGHNKYIRSLLLQIQRYHSTKLMAKILFKKRSVTDDELLLWMNNRLSIYQKMVKAMSKMHRNDTSLCNLGSNTVQMKANVRIPPTQLQPITRQTTQQMIGHR